MHPQLLSQPKAKDVHTLKKELSLMDSHTARLLQIDADAEVEALTATKDDKKSKELYVKNPITKTEQVATMTGTPIG